MIRSLLLLAAAAALPAAAPLSAFRGHARVLLLFAPRGDDPRLLAQDRMLAGARAGMADRNLAVVRVAGETVTGAAASAAALRSAYAVPADAFAVRLVGKDGHVADRADRPTEPARLFATIDAMPMRRDEVRRRGR